MDESGISGRLLPRFREVTSIPLGRTTLGVDNPAEQGCQSLQESLKFEVQVFLYRQRVFSGGFDCLDHSPLTR